MTLTRRCSVLILAFLYSLGSLAQESSSFYRLTKKACLVYPGDSPSNYISDSTHQYDNPLAATELGQMVLKNSFGFAYSEYNYASRSEILLQILKSSEFKQALNECYKGKALATSYFVFFLNQLDLQAKASSLQTKIVSLAGGGWILAKFSKFVIQRAAWMEKVFKWAGRIVTVSIVATIALSVGQNVYKMVRQFNDGLGYEIKDAVEEKKKEADYFQELALQSVQILEEQIKSLKNEIKIAKSESEKNDLQRLLNESELLAKNLQRQLAEIQKKLSSSEQK